MLECELSLLARADPYTESSALPDYSRQLVHWKKLEVELT